MITKSKAFICGPQNQICGPQFLKLKTVNKMTKVRKTISTNINTKTNQKPTQNQSKTMIN